MNDVVDFHFAMASEVDFLEIVFLLWKCVEMWYDNYNIVPI